VKNQSFFSRKKPILNKILSNQ